MAVRAGDKRDLGPRIRLGVFRADAHRQSTATTTASNFVVFNNSADP